MDGGLEYEANAPLEGPYHNIIRVDFLVHGKRTNSAILTLSSQSSTTAHNLANEVFRKWHDLAIPTRPEQRVTVWDDRYDTYREDDLARLATYSQVLALSDRQEIVQLVAA